MTAGTNKPARRSDAKICAIIPARGGSKGIPKKNLIPFCGKPLLAWSIMAAKDSRYIRRVYVSSDDREILAAAEQFGAAGIKRPKQIAGDKATSESALLHAVAEIEKITGKVEAVVFLQATSPVRSTGDIDGAVEKFLQEKADSLFSAAQMEDCCLWGKPGQAFKSISYDYKNRGRRQDRAPLFMENGSIYVFKPAILKKYNNRLGGKIAVYPMPFWKSFEIDRPDDIEICSVFMKKMLKSK